MTQGSLGVETMTQARVLMSIGFLLLWPDVCNKPNGSNRSKSRDSLGPT